MKNLKTALVISLIGFVISILALYKANSSEEVQFGSSYSPMSSFSSFYDTTVGTSAGQVLSADPGRSYALFTNDSDTAIYLNFSSASSTLANYAVRVNANGGVYEMSAAHDNLYLGEVWASSTAATKTLRTLVK